MARWTANIDDVKRIADISQQMPLAGIVQLILRNDQVVEGVMRGFHVGNNAGDGGWRYYGEVTVQTKDNGTVTIDYLDIKFARSAWSEQKAKE